MDSKKSIGNLLIFLGSAFAIGPCTYCQTAKDAGYLMDGVRKVRDIVIYEEDRFYSSFPSIVRLQNGHLLVAFRRAPDRKIFGESSSNHVDPNSYLVTLETDDVENWPTEPKLLHAHPFGGSQDPCLLLLPNGSLLCTSYGWAFVRSDGLQNLKKPYLKVADGAVFLGGYTLLSKDKGRSWQGPHYPLHLEQEVYFNAYGEGVPAYNRGAPYATADGTIYWIVAANDQIGKTSNHLLSSKDQGVSWNYISTVASDTSISFNEASILQTPRGDLVGFIRTAGMDDHAVIARSSDAGESFQWQSMGFKGHPLNALRLPDNRVLLTYGYRHKPFGIRARILNAECTDFEFAPEMILRNDGGNRDLGYTWPVLLDDQHVLVTYYFNKDNGTRHIAGTILEID